MRIATCQLKSASPYVQGKPVSTPKSRDETHDEHEQHTWKERCHVDQKGDIFIPPFCFKNSLAEGAKYKSISIPGKGKATFTKHFEAGVMCVEPMPLGVNIDDVQCWRHFVPSDGRRGGSKRVWKNFPIFYEWAGAVQFLVFDELINDEVFEAHLVDSGQFIGIGSFRPRNNGIFGRFSVQDIAWSKSR